MKLKIVTLVKSLMNIILRRLKGGEELNSGDNSYESQGSDELEDCYKDYGG